MKRLTTISLVCSLLIIPCVTHLHAQHHLEELLSRLDQNYMGGIHEVFSPEEINVLQHHFNTINPVSVLEEVAITRKGTSTKGNTPVAVVRLDPLDVSTIENLGPSPLTHFEGAGYVRTSPSLRGVIVDNENNVFLRDLNSNNYVSNGPLIFDIPNEVLTGIEVLSDGCIMGITTNGMDSSHLVEINPMTWTGTAIGPNNGLVLPINLARDASDALFTLNIDNDIVYRMDAKTGAATPIGNCGFDANFGQGMAYDAVSDEVLLTAFNNTTFDSELRRLDTNTGVASLLATITPGMIDQFGWVFWYDEDALTIGETNLEKFSIFPNPTSDILQIRAQHPINRITIINMLGQKIKSENYNTNAIAISIEALPVGLYFLRAYMEGHTQVAQFIKE